MFFRATISRPRNSQAFWFQLFEFLGEARTARKINAVKNNLLRVEIRRKNFRVRRQEKNFSENTTRFLTAFKLRVNLCSCFCLCPGARRFARCSLPRLRARRVFCAGVAAGAPSAPRVACRGLFCGRVGACLRLGRARVGSLLWAGVCLRAPLKEKFLPKFFLIRSALVVGRASRVGLDKSRVLWYNMGNSIIS